MTTQSEARLKQLNADVQSIEDLLEHYGNQTNFDWRYKETDQAFSRLKALATLADEVLSTVDLWRPKP